MKLLTSFQKKKKKKKEKKKKKKEKSRAAHTESTTRTAGGPRDGLGMRDRRPGRPARDRDHTRRRPRGRRRALRPSCQHGPHPVPRRRGPHPGQDRPHAPLVPGPERPVSTEVFLKALGEAKARGPFTIEFRPKGWLAEQIHSRDLDNSRSRMDVPAAVAQCVDDLLPAAIHDGLVARFLGCDPSRLFAPADAPSTEAAASAGAVREYFALRSKPRIKSVSAATPTSSSSSGRIIIKRPSPAGDPAHLTEERARMLRQTTLSAPLAPQAKGWMSDLTGFKLPSRHAALKHLIEEVNRTLGGDVSKAAMLPDPVGPGADMYAAAGPSTQRRVGATDQKAAVVGDGDGSETDLGAKEVLPAAALRPPMVQHPAVWLTDMADRVALHKRASEFARVYAERHFALELERHQRLAQEVEAGTSAVQTEPEIDEKHPDILAIRSQLPELEARIGKAKDVESEAHKAFQLAKKNYNEARQARKPPRG